MAETKEHVDGINRLESILSKMDDVSDVLKTKQLEGTTQIPDLQFMRKGKSYVLEYQCSPIGSEYERRHAIYASCGVSIFGFAAQTSIPITATIFTMTSSIMAIITITKARQSIETFRTILSARWPDIALAILIQMKTKCICVGRFYIGYPRVNASILRQSIKRLLTIYG